MRVKLREDGNNLFLVEEETGEVLAKIFDKDLAATIVDSANLVHVLIHSGELYPLMEQARELLKKGGT